MLGSFLGFLITKTCLDSMNSFARYYSSVAFPHGFVFCLPDRDGVWPGQGSWGSSYPCRGPSTSCSSSSGLPRRPPTSSSLTGLQACLFWRAAAGGARDAGASHQMSAETHEEDETQPTTCRTPRCFVFFFFIMSLVQDEHKHVQ